MAENKAGIRFTSTHYVEINLDPSVRTVTEEVDGVKTIYEIGEAGTGSFSVDLRQFKSVMVVGETQQLNVTLTDGAIAKYLSAAPSKFRVDENGLVTAVGVGTASRLRIEAYDTKDIKIGEIVLGIAVTEE